MWNERASCYLTDEQGARFKKALRGEAANIEASMKLKGKSEMRRGADEVVRGDVMCGAGIA